MLLSIIGLVLINASGIGVANAAVNSVEHQAYYLCKSGKAVRTIRIDQQVRGQFRCRTRYSKNGKENTVGQAKSITGCMPVAQNIIGNLKKANWKCRDIGKAKVIRSPWVRL